MSIHMNATIHTQITHESETQRQYPRFNMPSRVSLNGKEYEVKNLSTGGVALLNVEKGFARKNKISIDLKLPFSEFFLGITLSAEVQYYNSTDKILGCQFVDLGQEQISFLNYAIKSFIAGDIITSEKILNIASRNNFTKVRSHKSNNTPVSSFKRQLPGLLLVLLIGILITTIIAGNLYSSIFIVNAENAAVMGPTIAVNAKIKGVYISQLDPGLTLVQQNQVIGTVTPVGVGTSVAIQSPCNCYIAKTHTVSGELISQSQQIMSLLPMDAKPWIIAEIDPTKAKKIGSDSLAAISIFGSKTNYTGHVVSMESPLSDTRLSGNKTVLAKIIPDQKLPVDFVNRMAVVTFAIY